MPKVGEGEDPPGSGEHPTFERDCLREELSTMKEQLLDIVRGSENPVLAGHLAREYLQARILLHSRKPEP